MRRSDQYFVIIRNAARSRFANTVMPLLTQRGHSIDFSTVLPFRPRVGIGIRCRIFELLGAPVE